MPILLLVDHCATRVAKLREAASVLPIPLKVRRVAGLAGAVACCSTPGATPDLVVVRVSARQPEPGLATLSALARLGLDDALVALLPDDDEQLVSSAVAAGARHCLSNAPHAAVMPELFKILRRRTAPVSPDHVQLLVRVSEQAQRARTFLDAARVVVNATAEFEFARARLWLLSEDWQWLVGACQHGDPSLEYFESYSLPVVDSLYTQYVLHRREPVIFHGQELGPWLLSRQFSERGFAPPRGEWVHVPLWIGQRCWGILSLDNGAAPSLITETQRAMLHLFARQVAPALESAHLREHGERQRREHMWLTAINAVAANMQRAETIQAVGDALVRAGEQLGFERARLWLLDEGGQIAYGVSETGNAGIDHFSRCAFSVKDSPYMQQVLEMRQTIVFHGYPLGTGYLTHKFGSCGFGPPVGDWAALPLRAADEVRGVLMLDNCERERTLDEEQRTILDLLAGQAAAAIERARKTMERDWLQALAELLQQAQQAESFADGGSLVVAAHQSFGFERARLWSYSLAGNELVELAERGASSREFRGRRFLVSCAAELRALHEAPQLVVFSGSTPLDHGLDEIVGAADYTPSVGEAVLIPLSWDGRAVGILALDNIVHPRWLLPGQHEFLALLGREVAGTLERVRLLEEERRQREARNWLEALDELTKAIQSALSAEEIARRVVRGAATLGFPRARLWLLDDDQRTLRCVDQEGEPGVEGLVGFELALTDAIYVQHLLEGPDPRFFSGRSEALAHIDEQFVGHGFRPPAGEWASLPLWSHASPLGLLVLDRADDPRPLTSDERTLLRLLNRQVSAAIERARLIDEERRHELARDWLNELTEITTSEHQAPSLEEVAQVIVRGARRLGFERARLWRLDRDEIVGVAQSGNAGLEGFVNVRFALEDLPYSRLVLASRDPLVFDGRPYGPSGLDVRFGADGFQPPAGDWAELPILTSKGFWGLLTLDNIRQSRHLTEKDKDLVKHFASQAGAAIQRTQDRRRLASREQELDIISALMAWVLEVNIAAQGTASDFEQLEGLFARNLLAAASRLLGRADITAGLVIRKHESTKRSGQGQQIYRYFWEEGGELRHEDREKDMGRGISSIALREGVSQQVGDVCAPEWADVFIPGIAQHTRSELDVPIIVEGGRVIGVLNLESPRVGAFTADHGAIIERLSRVAALAFGNLQRQRFLHATLAAVTRLAAAAGRAECRQAIVDALLMLTPDLAALMVWEADIHDEVALEPFVLHNVYNTERRQLEDDGSVHAAREVLDAPAPLWFTQVSEIPLPNLSWLCRIQGLRSVVALPLIGDDDQRLGAMLLGYREQREFTLEERTLFPVVAATIATSLRDVRRLADLAAREVRLQAALTITGAVGISQRLEEILAAILRALSEIFPGTQIFVRLYREATARLELIPECLPYYQITELHRYDPAGLALDDGSISCFLARQFERSPQPAINALNISDVTACASYLRLVDSTRSQLTAVLADGATLLGVIGVESPHLNAFNDDDVRVIEEVSRQISQVIMRAVLGARLRRTLLVSARTTWAALLAHDINREIGSIRNQVFLARRAAPLEPAADKHLRLIDHHAARLAGTMNLIEHDGDQGIRTFPINAWLASEIPAMLAGDSYETEIVPLSGEIEVRLHVFLLRTALLLLVRNAREAMGHAGRLTVRTRRDAMMLEIEIEDNGPGIPDHVRQYLFDEPGTTKANGGGLGLIFVRLLVEEDLGGAVRLKPQEPGRGAVFVLRLPADDRLIRGGNYDC